MLYIHPHRTRQWLPELPSEVSLSLLGCQRLGPRLSLLIRQHYKLSAFEYSNSADLEMATLDFSLLSRIPALAGSIFHGRRLRTLISKTAIAEFFTGIDENADSLAVTHADWAPLIREERS